MIIAKAAGIHFLCWCPPTLFHETTYCTGIRTYSLCYNDYTLAAPIGSQCVCATLAGYAIRCGFGGVAFCKH